MTAVIGAGVIGCAVAHALAREGHHVLLIDRAEPGCGGASYGHVGHIAAELVQPLPSRQLLFGFWRELFMLDGPLHIPLRRLGAFAPWVLQFARAAFRREINTQHLAPLVKPAAAAFEQLFREIGQPDLIRRNGHYQVWFGPTAQRRAAQEAADMQRLGVPTEPMSPASLHTISRAANEAVVAGLLFPDSGHILDPLWIVQALVQSAAQCGTELMKTEVRALRPAGELIQITTDSDQWTVSAAVVCAGAWSAPLLAPFGLSAPLEAAYGYHVELEEHAPHVDGPLVYMNQEVLVTPMAGRLRASTHMEFSGLDSRPDARKPAQLRRKLRGLGFSCDAEGPSWRGPRPVLPDYLPGIGRAPGPHRLFYAIGHQHIGLTMAPVTAGLIADLAAGRTPRHDISAFDLRRFGRAS